MSAEPRGRTRADTLADLQNAATYVSRRVLARSTAEHMKGETADVQ